MKTNNSIASGDVSLPPSSYKLQNTQIRITEHQNTGIGKESAIKMGQFYDLGCWKRWYKVMYRIFSLTNKILWNIVHGI